MRCCWITATAAATIAKILAAVLFSLLLQLLCVQMLLTSVVVMANPDAKRLYDDLLSNYNKLVRPVVNTSDVLRVCIKLKLSQLIDVNLKNQIMTTNLWVEQSWYDYKLRWEPKEYGGVQMLHVPSDHIWRPDIVLYNNADGDYEVTLMTKATVYCTGLVVWQPPTIYKSSCAIDVEYFPYDEQTCVLKLGSWTYDGFKVDLRHMDEKKDSNVVEMGVDLSELSLSVEWDIIQVPAVRNEKYYTCCDEPYLDITFNITMRRKTLFYTVNIIIPCMGISFLTVLTFYLPSDSGEKVTLSISILISLHVFFLLVVEIIPPTSLVIPLLGKYLIFAMVLVSISICVTVVVLNVHFRSPQTHKMAPWVKRVFIHILPKLLAMKRPRYRFEANKFNAGSLVLKNRDIHPCFFQLKQTAAHTNNRVLAAAATVNDDGDDNEDDDDDELFSANRSTSSSYYANINVSEPEPEPTPTTNVAAKILNTTSRRHKSSRRCSNDRQSSLRRSMLDTTPFNNGCQIHGHQSMQSHFAAGTFLTHGHQFPYRYDCRNANNDGNGYDDDDHHHHHHHHHQYEHSNVNGNHNRNGNGGYGNANANANANDRDGCCGRFANAGCIANSLTDATNICNVVDQAAVAAAAFLHSSCPSAMHKSCFCVRLIAEHTKMLEDSTKVKEDWKYVAMVLDRLFLWIFTLAVLAGTAGIILQAPTLFDDRIPIPAGSQHLSYYRPPM